MRKIDLFYLQLVDIELFLQVAKYGNFTKAGQVLFMTQSRVSKRVNLLEQELGLQLFIRNKRKVILTPAGRVLQKKFENIYEDMLGAIEEAHNTQCGMSGQLKLGFLEWGNLNFMLSIKNFMIDNPEISLEITRYSFWELRENLLTNKIDIAFTTSYEATSFSDSSFEYIKLLETALVACINKKNPLASCTSLSISDLKKENILMLYSNDSPGYCEYIGSLFAQNNIHPLISHYAHNGGDHIGNLILNEGILLASGNFLADSWAEQIAQIPIKGSHVDIIALWKKENSNHIIKQFLESLDCFDIHSWHDVTDGEDG